MLREIPAADAPRRTLAWLVVAEVAMLAVLLVWKRLDGLDLEIYRLGAQAFLGGGDLYGPLPPTTDGTMLPFLYPPFAAVAFAPLLAVPVEVGLVAVTVVGAVGLGAVLALSAGRIVMSGALLTKSASNEPLMTRGGLAVAGVVTLVAQALALLSEPVRATLGFGQVNLLLMLLAGVDTLATERHRMRGVLVGVAAAVKLTPAVFVLFFLLRRDFRATANAVAAFVVCGAVAWVLSPETSARYWTDIVTGHRIDDPGYIANQSLRGLLARLDQPAWVWPLACALVLAGTVLVMRRALAARQPALAVLACAVGALLVSPLSWTHHWVWSGPAVAVVCVLTLRKGRARAAVLLGLAAVLAWVFVASPLWDHRDVWPLRESYVLAGGLLLVLFWLLALDDPLDAPGERGDVVGLDGREHPDP
ncbi:glycosyltransferase 87 family protein [Prauserella shujinwangii]|uniref:glycosyltransferase 87 family protein n=1 Tax=Prauserella shujinwangii TaxID=1453103 RepID=UPI001FE62692|nr:glycosyltransferase 87 family protein [Prauserella shujinwangii]